MGVAPSVRDLAALRLAAIVEWSDDAIVSKDLTGIVMTWNRAAERMFGYTAEEAVGRSIRLIIPADRQAEEDEVLRRIVQGDVVDHFQTVRRRKDGRLIDISLTVSPIRDSDGTIVGASKIARDITEQKRVTAEFQALQGRLTALVEASSTLLESPKTEAVVAATISMATQQLTADGYALWRAEPDGAWRVARSVGVSPEFGRRVVEGVAPATEVPAGIGQALVVDDVLAEPLLGGQAEAYRAEGIRSMLVLPLTIARRRSGTLVFYSRTPARFTELDVVTGRALANLAATAITTAQLYDRQDAYRQAAERGRHRAAFLAQAGQLMSASLDYEKTLASVAAMAVPAIADWCAVDVVDEEGRPRRLAMSHVDRAKVDLARQLQERYPEDTEASAGVGAVIRSGKAVVVEEITPSMLERAARDEEHARLLRALAPISYLCVPLATRDRTLGAITFAMAESGRHYEQEDLQFFQAVAARAALAVENARAYQRLNEASRIKDQFLATLSHELRTPLNAILGYARMFRLGINADDPRRVLEIIERNSESLKRLIDDVLDVSRIVAGKFQLSMRTMQLVDVLYQAAASVQPAANARGINLVVSVDSADDSMWGDADRLQQVLWNLLSNAVKFTPEGGRVEASLRQADGGHVEIVVSDNGKGIDPAFLPLVFDRFRQADAGFARDQGGLGLGLAIVREIVEMHGGTVQAESQGTGTGSTFRVRLPVAKHPAAGRGDGEAARDTARPPAPERLEVPRLDAVRVLLVDDEEDALGMLQAILRAAGAEVRTRTSAAAAATEIARDVPDVLVSDLGMPGMDGLELIRAVRQSPDPRVRVVPAIAISAYARAEDRSSALASGYQLHVGKPADPVELIEAVASLASTGTTEMQHDRGR